MPVNDSPATDDAQANCALCTVAGILGTSAEAEKTWIEKTLGGRMKEAKMAFYVWAVVRKLSPQGLAGTNPLKAQIRGVSDYMFQRAGYAPVTIGSVDDPLTEAELAASMLAMPDGTPFAYLVMSQEMRDMGAVEAHWLTAWRRGGAIAFTDFQLEVPEEMAYAMGRLTKVRSGWGTPRQSDVPMEAFGQPSSGSNRYMAVGFLK